MKTKFVQKVLFLLVAIFLISCGGEEDKKEEGTKFECSICKKSETCDTKNEKCNPIEGYCENDQDCVNETDICDLDFNTCKEEVIEGTIYPVRNGDFAVNSSVTVKGTVTGIKYDEGSLKGFYIQEVGKNYRGIFIYPSKTVNTALTIGDELTVTGIYKEYNGLSEVVIESDAAIVKSGVNKAIEKFSNLALDNLLAQKVEEYESMLVIVKGKFVIGEKEETDNIAIKTENGMKFLIKDDLYDLSSLSKDNKLSEIRGVLTFSYGKFKILPRGEEDLIDNSIICSQVDCLEGEVCEVSDETPLCVCDEVNGFFGNGSGTCINPCKEDTCTETNKNICISSSSTAYKCECNTGFDLDESGACVQSPYCNPDTYSSAFGKTGTELKTALKTIIKKNYQSYGYEAAKRAMFSHIDNENGRIMGVYTGQYFNHPYQENRSLQTKTNENDFNCEHTWPQSKLFGGGKDDLHHLYPTFSRVNSSRSNYPFGVVSGGKTFGSGDYISKMNNKVFEPANQHKGNVARAMLYMWIKYDNPENFMNQNNQLNTFKAWHELDPVDEKDRTRNDLVETYQYNRNPFVDCPQFVDALYR